MPFKVIDRDTNRKLVHELLLLIYSNLCRITHRFRDTSCFTAENHGFAYPSCIEFEVHAVGMWRRNSASEN